MQAFRAKVPCAVVVRSDVIGGAARGCRGAVAVAELEHHLRDAG
jgi:hypothetical protein